jgi:hypothetical protein
MSNRRVVNVQSLIATGVNVDGHRKIVGLDVISAEDGVGWLASRRQCPWRRETFTGHQFSRIGIMHSGRSGVLSACRRIIYRVAA